MMFVLVALCSLFYYSLSFLMSSSLTTSTAALILPNVTAVYIGTFLLAENASLASSSLCASLLGSYSFQSFDTLKKSSVPMTFHLAVLWTLNEAVLQTLKLERVCATLYKSTILWLGTLTTELVFWTLNCSIVLWAFKSIKVCATFNKSTVC
ncbi:hypothetical protein C8J56DRAFT_899275 [Mycena floridula]|nr:hypothetical protein C8J56DRAFT_899275 [Mycena floridula]